MKLTKAQLLKALGPSMEHYGFHVFKDSITGAQGLFAKKLNDSLYLTIGMTIHRYYEDAYTADLYLSKTTAIYTTWGDIPKDCIKRPHQLLQQMDGINSQQDWWSIEDSVDDFLHAIELSANRMCQDTDLIRRINESKDIADICMITSLISKNVFNLPNMVFSCIPQKEVDDIPFNWFKSAEWVLNNMGRECNSRIVRFYASDAYRQYVLSLQEADGSKK